MKNLTRFALVLSVVVSSLTLADETPPPPPDAPASEGSGMRREGFLLDRSEHSTRPMLLSIHAIVPYGHFYGGFGIGVGAAFYIPLVKDGFIGSLNDEFGIDFGADTAFYFFYSGFFSLTIPVCALWTFHITDKFSAYAKVGLALKIHPGYTFPVFPDGVGVVGINYMLSSGFGLRAEVGYPGLKVGILFAF